MPDALIKFDTQAVEQRLCRDIPRRSRYLSYIEPGGTVAVAPIALRSQVEREFSKYEAEFCVQHDDALNYT